MKELFQKMMKKLRKHSEAAGAIAALLLIVLFSGVMILGIRTQRESVPENPIDGEKLDGHVDRHERSAGRADKREWKQPAADAESAVRKSGYAGDGERIVKRKRS